MNIESNAKGLVFTVLHALGEQTSVDLLSLQTTFEIALRDAYDRGWNEAIDKILQGKEKILVNDF